ncbi:MAG: cytochrome B [Betaproteobacteria bacterium HGW-Betaproteobacteria-1]|jgi:cytochrome b561|nr:MAG: cytochrome B [Betaproteobacteria bacterium HGW-Betaproteobacteria-1]
MNNSIARYTKTAVILHWLIAFGILFMLALGWFMTDLPREGAKSSSYDLFNLGVYTWQLAEEVTPRTFYFNLHKSIGVTLLALIAFRLYWRLTHQPPALLSSLKVWEKKLAETAHTLLYVLMVAMPVSGLLMALYSKYGVKWFGLAFLPGMDNKAVREAFLVVHEWIGVALALLILLHIVGALKHKFINKDETLKRMSLH